MNSAEAKVPNVEGDWQSIEIFLFSNGQENSPPRKYHLRAEDLNNWDDILNNLAQSHYGLQHSLIYLYTTNGHLIEGPLDLKDGMAYVAVEPPEGFIDTGYEKYLIKASRSWEKRQARRNNSGCQNDQPCCLCPEINYLYPEREECKNNVPYCLCPEKDSVTAGHEQYLKEATGQAGFRPPAGHSVLAKVTAGTLANEYGPRSGDRGARPSECGSRSGELDPRSGENATRIGNQKIRSGEYVPSPGKGGTLSGEQRDKLIDYEAVPEEVENKLRSRESKTSLDESEPRPDGGAVRSGDYGPRTDKHLAKPTGGAEIPNESGLWTDKYLPSIGEQEPNGYRSGENKIRMAEPESRLDEPTISLGENEGRPDEYESRAGEYRGEHSGKRGELEVRAGEQKSRDSELGGRVGDLRGRGGKHELRSGEQRGRESDYAARAGEQRGRNSEHGGKLTDSGGREGEYGIRAGEQRGRGSSLGARFGELGARANPAARVGAPGARLNPGARADEPRTRGSSGVVSGAAGLPYIPTLQQVRKGSISTGKPSTEKKRLSAGQRITSKKPTPLQTLPVQLKKHEDKKPFKNSKEGPPKKVPGKAPSSGATASTEIGKPKIVPKYPHNRLASPAIPPAASNFVQPTIKRKSTSLTKITSSHIATNRALDEDKIGDKEIILISTHLYGIPASEIDSMRLDTGTRPAMKGIKDSYDKKQAEQINLNQSAMSIPVNEGVQTYMHQLAETVDKNEQGVPISSKVTVTCSPSCHRDNMVEIDDPDNNYISITNRGDVVNFKLNIQVRNVRTNGRSVNSRQKTYRRSQSLTNIMRTEKGSHISIEEVKSKSFQSILNNEYFRGSGFEDQPKVMVVQCSRCAERLNNPPQCEPKLCNDSKKYFVLLPNQEEEDIDDGCTCGPACQTYGQKRKSKNSSGLPVKKTISEISIEMSAQSLGIIVTTTNSTCQTEDPKSDLVNELNVSVTEDPRVSCNCQKLSSSQISMAQTQFILIKNSNPQISPQICSIVGPPVYSQECTQTCPHVHAQVCTKLYLQIKSQKCSQLCPQVCPPQEQTQVCPQKCPPQEQAQVCPPQEQAQVCSPQEQVQVCPPQELTQVCLQICPPQEQTQVWQAKSQRRSQVCPQVCPQVSPEVCPLVCPQVCPQVCPPEEQAQVCTPQEEAQVCPPQEQTEVSPQVKSQKCSQMCPLVCPHVYPIVCPQVCPPQEQTQACPQVKLRECSLLCPKVSDSFTQTEWCSVLVRKTV